MNGNNPNPTPRILVTGGSGFIGTNYVELLLRENINFINIDIKTPSNPEHNKYWRQCDILDFSKLDQIVKEFSPTQVVHLAAKTGVSENNLQSFAANIQGVQNMIDSFKGLPDLERIIFTSSLLVCKMGYVPKNDTDYNPSTFYGQSKVEGEKIVRAQKDLPYHWVIVRPISVWGPWFNEPYKNFFKAIAQGWYFHIGSGHYRRSLGYVENTVFQIHKLLQAPAPKVNQRTIYLADDQPLDLYDFAASVQQSLGAPKVRHFPKWVALSAARVGDVLKALGWKNVPLSTFRLNNILTEYIFDMSPIMEICGKLPYNYKSGVQRTLDWLKKTKQI